MRRVITIIVLLLSIGFVGFSVTARARAANTLVPECKKGDVSKLSACKDVNDSSQTVTNNKIYGPSGVLTKAAGLITYIGGITAVIMIILGGFTFITGSGDPNSLTAARKTIIYAVVGLVVLVIPSAIIKFVISRL